MTTRRDFIKNGSLALTGSLLIPDFLHHSKPHLGVQLYSVRDEIVKTPQKVLEQIARIGYKEVEGYGYENGKFFGLTVKEFKKTLNDLGLRIPSCHMKLTLKQYDPVKKDLTDEWKVFLDVAAELGQKYVICPFMEVGERPNAMQFPAIFNQAGELCRQRGLQFGYHNHDFEFKPAEGGNGKLIYEVLLQETDPKLVVFEMDLYWVNFAKHNPVDWFKKYPGRFPLAHFKDMAKSEKQETIEVGDGSIDFNQILKHKGKAGLKYLIVELEHYKTTPLEGIEKAYKNMLKLKGV